MIDTCSPAPPRPAPLWLEVVGGATWSLVGEWGLGSRPVSARTRRNWAAGPLRCLFTMRARLAATLLNAKNVQQPAASSGRVRFLKNGENNIPQGERDGVRQQSTASCIG